MQPNQRLSDRDTARRLQVVRISEELRHLELIGVKQAGSLLWGLSAQNRFSAHEIQATSRVVDPAVKPTGVVPGRARRTLRPGPMLGRRQAI